MLKMVDLVDSEFVFVLLPDSEKGRFKGFAKAAEPSTREGRRFGRPRRDSHFHL